jgi:hypothetical protein
MTLPLPSGFPYIWGIFLIFFISEDLLHNHDAEFDREMQQWKYRIMFKRKKAHVLFAIVFIYLYTCCQTSFSYTGRRKTMREARMTVCVCGGGGRGLETKKTRENKT